MALYMTTLLLLGYAGHGATMTEFIMRSHKKKARKEKEAKIRRKKLQKQSKFV